MQQFVTLQIGSLWFDVPIGPLVSLLSKSSLRSMAASATKQDQDMEVFSASMEKFTHAFSKSAEQNMTFAKKASCPDNVTPTPLSYRKREVIDVGKSPSRLYKNKGEVQEFKDVEFAPLCERKDEMVHKYHCMQSGKGGEVVPIFPHA